MDVFNNNTNNNNNNNNKTKQYDQSLSVLKIAFPTFIWFRL